MSRIGDVVRLNGDEYDRLMDEKEILRQECERAWREVEFISNERTEHLSWRTRLADKLAEVEKSRDDLLAEVSVLRKVVTAVKALHDNAEEWECDGLGLWAQHGFWEDVFDAIEELESKNG